MKYKHPVLFNGTPRVIDEDACSSAGLAEITDPNHPNYDPNPLPKQNGFSVTVNESNVLKKKIPSKKQAKRPPSSVWTYMVRENEEQISCQLCNRKFKYHGSTTSLWNHLKAKHPAEIEAAMQERLNLINSNQNMMEEDHVPELMAASTSTPSQTLVKQERTNIKFENRGRKPVTGLGFKYETSKKKILDKAITDMIVLDLQPLNIVEERGFRKLVQTLEPRYVFPTQNQLINNILPNLHKDQSVKLKAELERVPYVTVTTELWATPITEGFLTVSVHYLDKEWKMHSSVLETCKITEAHTQDTIAEELSRIFQNWGILGKITCVVIDNSANIDAAVQILRLPHLPCLAYTMDWIVQESIKNVPDLITVKKKVRDIVSMFRHSTADMKALLDIQRENGVATPKKLKIDVESRWLSTFYMLERFIQLYDFIPTVMYQMGKADISLTEAEVELVRHCVKTLEPFEVAVKEMTSEKHMPLSKVIPMTRAISQFVSRTTESLGGDSTGLSTELELQMSQHFSGIEQNPLYGAATIVDPRFKKLPFSSSEVMAITEHQLSEEIMMNAEPGPQQVEKVDASADKSKSLWSSFDQQVRDLPCKCIVVQNKC